MNPNRTSKNIAGDFYTVGHWAKDGEWGDCLDCAIPEAEAPNLLADLLKEDTYTHFVRQPESVDEIEQACRACEVCCVNALRYGGKNKNIIQRLFNNPEYCDYLVTDEGELKYCLNEKGEQLPFADKYRVKANKLLQIKYGKKQSFIQRICSVFSS